MDDTMEKVFELIDIFKFKCPLPIVITKKKDSFTVSFGKKHKFDFQYHPDILPHDYLTMMENALIEFYPQYDCVVEKYEKFSREELSLLVSKNKVSLDNALFIEKKTFIHEKGRILKVYMKADQFHIQVNGIISVRQTPILMSSFLKNVRTIMTQGGQDLDLRNYIFNNSVEVIANLAVKPIPIHLKENQTQIESFFRINFENIQKNERNLTPIEIEKTLWLWDRFQIHFPSEESAKKVESFFEEKGVTVQREKKGNSK
jgi:hypothetical protein